MYEDAADAPANADALANAGIATGSFQGCAPRLSIELQECKR